MVLFIDNFYILKYNSLSVCGGKIFLSSHPATFPTQIGRQTFTESPKYRSNSSANQYSSFIRQFSETKMNK